MDFADISLTNGAPPEGTNQGHMFMTKEDYRILVEYNMILKGNTFCQECSVVILRLDLDLEIKWVTSSLTAGWIVSDEGFFGESKVVNFLKLRGSYGIVGNDRIPIMVISLS
jgi:hypothetical protein